MRRQASLVALRYAGGVLGVPGLGLSGLLDPAPLRVTIGRMVEWSAIHRNVRDGTLDAVAVVASDAANPRRFVFIETGQERRLPPAGSVEYVPVELSGEHVRASSAIPVLFPAVRVDQPPDARGWYYDGAPASTRQ